MVLLSENFKRRLQELAGIQPASQDPFAGSEKRVPFNKDLMIQAIKQGREVGISFQSNNDKYKMPVAKWRVIYPVAIGISKKGSAVIRGFHKFGQSEKEAIRTGKRSAELQNAWRLFKVDNIKSMWFTGNFFRGPLEAYNDAGDKSMINVEIKANFPEIIKYQDDYISSINNKKEQEQKRKNIVHFFKQNGERPVEQPISNPGTSKPGEPNPNES